MKTLCSHIFCLLAFCGGLIAQPAEKRPVAPPLTPMNAAGNNFALSKSTPDLGKDLLLKMNQDARRVRPSSMNLSLDWTNYQMHRVSDSVPLDITLSGKISSDIECAWTLTPQPTRAYGPPNLSRLGDVVGHEYPMGTDPIPLTWTIALDGGAFNPMIVLPDYSLQALFPPGPHTFQVRATGALQHGQADGYYNLHLTQNLTPRL